MSPFLYIDTKEGLDTAVDSLSREKRIALDTESSGYFTYFTELCLLQVSAGEFHCVVDPLAGVDLSPLREILSSSSIVKIFHAASADVPLLKGALNCEINNIFDTLIAARMLGIQQCSLAALVESHFRIRMEKEEQKSDWRKRPLSRSQLDYAHRDTVYLERLMDVLLSKFSGSKKIEYLREEFEELVSISPQEEKKLNPMGWMKIPGALTLGRESRSRLRRVWLIRENRARAENIAPFRLMGNSVLLRIVSERPRTADALRKKGWINPVFLDYDSEHILNALTSNEIQDDSYIFEKKHSDEEAKALLQKLKKWRQAIADAQGIDVTFIASNRILERLVEAKPRNTEELKNLNLFGEGKFRRYEKSLLAELHERRSGENLLFSL